MGTTSDSVYMLSGKDTASICWIERSSGMDTLVDVGCSLSAETTSMFKVGDVQPHHSKLAGIVMCMVNLKDIGFSEAEIKEIAKEKMVTDGPNSDGEMFQRPAKPSDNFVSPYPNEEAARAANNGAHPVDLSLIVKAREDGANHLFSILTGYMDAPEDVTLMPGLYYNPYFDGNQIAMPPPLVADQVQFADGTPATLEQMSRDVTIFLQWAAEPEMEHRKSMGLKVLIFLSIFTTLFFVAKKHVWRSVYH